MANERPWNSELAIGWLETSKWTANQATAILMCDRNPGVGVTPQELEAFLSIVSTFFDSYQSNVTALHVGSDGLPPDKWIKMYELLGESLPPTLVNARSEGPKRKMRKDKEGSLYLIIRTLSRMKPLDLKDQTASSKIAEKASGLISEATVRNYIKAAARAGDNQE